MSYVYYNAISSVLATVLRSIGRRRKYFATRVRGQEFARGLSEIPPRQVAELCVGQGALTSRSTFAKMPLLVMPRPSSWRSTRDMISPGLEAGSPQPVDADPTRPLYTGED